jgi:hypothetical protein
MITISNIREVRPGFIDGTLAVYVGRENHTNPRLAQSPLANPYHIGKDGDRDEVICKYRAWLHKQTKSDTPARRELERLVNAHKFQGSNLTLLCWCAPQHCHAEIIKSAIEWLETKINQPTTKNCGALPDNRYRTCWRCGKSQPDDIYNSWPAGLCPQDPKTLCGLLL